jgi:hypothetical protein
MYRRNKSKRLRNGLHNNKRNNTVTKRESLSIAKQFVRNLSSQKLTPNEYELLAKGIKFVPSRSHTDKNALIHSLYEMGRKMQLTAKYGQGEGTMHPLYTPSGYNPGPVELNIEEYLEQTRQEIENNLSTTISLPNLTKKETEAIKMIRERKNIVISKADKNSTIIVVDEDDYMTEGMRHLNQIHYREADPSVNLHKTKQTILQEIEKMWKNNQIDKTT